MFDEIINRRGSNSIKWQVQPGELPMWIADMDFATAPAWSRRCKPKLTAAFLAMKRYQRRISRLSLIGMSSVTTSDRTQRG